MTRAGPKPVSSGPGIAVLVSTVGVVLLAASAGLVIWLLAVAQPPGLDRLEQVTGRVKSASSGEPTLTLVVSADGRDYELVLPQSKRLPARDWPLQSINTEAPVVAWYVPADATKLRGTLWQLHRGRQRVVALEDTCALHKEWILSMLSWCSLGLLSGAALTAVALGSRRSS